ncbi:MAG: hypothetical protein K9M98_08585 [Cephaloticoccus sp.]|nr:hypothetical protein [Cephaloticoccus sp.]MCF7760546.1 hypothetical protein [Cephaloticoccus sp.]
MKNLLLTAVLIMAACGLSYGVFYTASRDPKAVREALADRDAMAWLRSDFKLTDAQFAAIKRLHEDYHVECSAHCAAILDAREHHAPAPEIARLEEVCERSMTEHFKKVAALMSPEEGPRYLAVVLPKVADYDHHGAPSLQVRP